MLTLPPLRARVRRCLTSGLLSFAPLLSAQEPAPALAPPPAAPVLTTTVFAGPGLVSHPVAVAVNDQGRVFIAASHRAQGRGVVSTEGQPGRVAEDLGLSSTRSHALLLRSWLARGELKPEIDRLGDLFMPGEDFLKKFSEEIIQLDDENGDGVADQHSVFAGGFNEDGEGPAGGLLAAADGTLYFACSPTLWALKDPDQAGRSVRKNALATGLGIRAGWAGHELRSLVQGPDGRLYFCLGDRGFSTRARENRGWFSPGEGAVFRCWPDGSGLELFARGLRRPSQPAFDDLGRLFVADAGPDDTTGRLYYVPPGADFGWDASAQDTPAAAADLAASAAVLPPAGSLPPAPAAFLFNPGPPLSADLAGHFLLSDFRPGNPEAGLFAVHPEPSGAGFTVPAPRRVDAITSAAALAFAPDGRLLVADWGPSPGLNDKGQVLALTHADPATTTLNTESAALLKAGFRRKTSAELAPLLSHADLRLRLRAQQALVEKGWAVAQPVFAPALKPGLPAAGRRHALWGLGQLGREQPLLLAPARALLRDPDPAFRAQACTVLGEARDTDSGPAVLQLLQDSEPAVRAAACPAAGQLAPDGALPALLAVLRTNPNSDPFLRHAAATGLARLGQPRAIVDAALHDPDQPVRLGTVLALRQLASPLVSAFLADSDPAVATEAARVIYDLQLFSEFSALSATLSASPPPQPAQLRRALAAAAWLGRSEDATLVANFAAREPGAPDDLRVLAISLLEKWDALPAREPVLARHAPPPARDPGLARRAARAQLPALLKSASPAVQQAATALSTTLGPPPPATAFVTTLADPESPEGLKFVALRSLEDSASKDPANFVAGLTAALRSPGSPRLRAEARTLLARRDPAQAMTLASDALVSGAPVEKQAAVRLLDRLRTADADRSLSELLLRLRLGSLDPSIVVEVLEAAERRAAPDGPGKAFASQLDALNAAQATAADPLMPWRGALADGDPVTGRSLFLTSSTLQCTRCHPLDGRGPGTAPDLAGLASRLNPAQILESTVQPSARLVPGYGMVNLTLLNSSTLTGTLIEQTPTTLTLQTSTALRTLPLSRLTPASRNPAPASPCLPLGTLLTLRELRDLNTWLRSLDH